MTEEGTMVLLRGIPIDEALLTYIGTLPDLIRYYFNRRFFIFSRNPLLERFFQRV